MVLGDLAVNHADLEFKTDLDRLRAMCTTAAEAAHCSLKQKCVIQKHVLSIALLLRGSLASVQ
jgi:hypothetical protein